ncbi:uncharacterized protein V1516DRAFT_683574 [Lipomyces oligophaga]|uniref:uncharacterized protein n=1 Tax=Lipomyces oligophaga TaxID=45792 RepID=UPI0034CF9614
MTTKTFDEPELGRNVPDFEIQILHHPPVHQKLQLSSQDVRYLQNMMLERAQDKINAAIPAIDLAADDPVRDEVEARVREFVLRTFDLSKYSLVVDGIEASDPGLSSLMAGTELESVTADGRKQPQFSHSTRLTCQEIEPFDLELNEQVRDLYTQIDNATVAVTNLRRKTPLQVVAKYAQELEDWSSRPSPISGLIQAETDPHDDTEVFPRQERVAQDYNALMVSLADIKKNVMDTAAKINRADEALAQYELNLS